MDSLFLQIDILLPLSLKAKEALTQKMQKVQVEKGNFLISESSICQHLYFLEKGALRGFYYLESKEITHWFSFENDFVTSFHSFITRKPSVENVQAIEDCTLWSIGKDSLEDLYNKFPEIERLGRLACEQYYIRLEERYVNAQFKTAAERYKELLETKTDLLLRLPLGYIASYLGISQETLSRIRSKKL